MSIEQLNLILYDMYLFDSCFMSQKQMFKFKDKQDQISYTRWAVNEIERAIIDGLYPEDRGEVDEIISIVATFVKKMGRYAAINSKRNAAFRRAQIVAADIIDLLEAAKDERRKSK